MFTKKWVFDEQHVPEDLVHRDAELSELTRAFSPTLRGRHGDNVLISGPSGVGKTVTCRRALELLDEQQTVPSIQLQCITLTKCDIFRRVLGAIPGTTPPGRDTPALDVLDELRSAVDQPVIVVLDEADCLPELSVLGDLLQVTEISVVAISHQPDRFLSRVDSNVRDQFRGDYGSHIPFEQYTVDELVAILQARADHGLIPGVVDDEQLETIAADVGGAARHAIQSLRSAAELAVDRGHQAVRDDDIVDGIDAAEDQIRQQKLRSLGYHHHVLYEIVRSGSEGSRSSSEVHDLYDELGDDLYQSRGQTGVSRRRRRDILDKLEEYHLVESSGENRWRRYQVCDSSIEAPVDVDVGRLLPIE